MRSIAPASHREPPVQRYSRSHRPVRPPRFRRRGWRRSADRWRRPPAARWAILPIWRKARNRRPRSSVRGCRCECRETAPGLRSPASRPIVRRAAAPGRFRRSTGGCADKPAAPSRRRAAWPGNLSPGQNARRPAKRTASASRRCPSRRVSARTPAHPVQTG